MIKIYARGTQEEEALQLAAKILSMESPTGVEYTVGETYFDLGAGKKWTTIIATREDGSSWQALNPREHRLIVEDFKISEAVTHIWDSPYNPDRVE